MALTIDKLSPNPDFVAGNKRFKFRKITFDSSYPDGGEAVTASEVGLRKIDAVIFMGQVTKTDEEGAFAVSWDYDAGKIVVFEGDNNNAADAPFVEAGVATTDLSSYTVHALFLGW